ncbi:MAG TPA: hypothetical protein VJ796_07135 [Acidimicrobiia bacterium]|jgi:hypothetical protein|nr:hypothetical protein [Acidimicrobiia bacterium]
MRIDLANFRPPTLIAACLSLPFAILEFVFRFFVRPDSRVVLDAGSVLGLLGLLGFLWALPFSATAIAGRLINEEAVVARRLLQPWFIAQVAFVVGLALLWSALVADQLPCFLAVPNCD